MKARQLAPASLVLLLVVVLFTACPNPITTARGGVLTVSINNNINARTLLPPIDTTAASFTISGTGPGAATFSQASTGAPVTLDGLAFGAWSVTVNALNSAGTLIGSGQATVTVHTGQTATADITVVPLTGNGTLDLTVSWTASQVENASILASLTPPVGASTPLSFSVSGGQATYSSTTIPAGYQTLTVQLLDGVMPVMGAVEVVRIVAGQTTSGTYAFTNVNQPGGTVQVNITPAMAEPILVSISGVPATMAVGGSMTATASVSDGTANVSYVWYLNGVSVGVGASYTVGSTVAAGYYRLDVTAYSADGTRAGSATASFQVTTPSAGGIITTVAGNGTRGYFGDGGAATSGELNQPTSVAFDSEGNFYVADQYNHRVRRVSRSGIITTVAGNGAAGYSGDGGPATSAELSYPIGVAVDAAFNVYIADYGNDRIRKVSGDGTITTVAGNGVSGYSGDGGPAASAELRTPHGVACDGSGNLYIADFDNSCIRKVSADGTITTVAGNGTGGYSGDGGPATLAQLWEPFDVAVDAAGTLYIGENSNLVRKVSARGIITTVAGNMTVGYSGDGGPATSAQLWVPISVAVDATGNLYIADNFNQRVRKVSPDGTITTVAGNGIGGYSGDGGPATAGEVRQPFGVAVDAAGNLYIADTYNDRIRKVSTP